MNGCTLMRFAPPPPLINIPSMRTFKRYVVCFLCHSLYYLDSCVEGSGRYEKGRLCSFVWFPNHPQWRMHQTCRNVLVKSVELATRRKLFYPYLVYCYLGINPLLQRLLTVLHFLKHVSSGDRNYTNNVYDGKIWNSYQQYEGQALLSDHGCFAITMNIDFFNHTR